MFNVTVTAKFSTHAKLKIHRIVAYRSTFVSPDVCEKNDQFLSSTAHERKLGFFCLTVCSIAKIYDNSLARYSGVFSVSLKSEMCINVSRKTLDTDRYKICDMLNRFMLKLHFILPQASRSPNPARKFWRSGCPLVCRGFMLKFSCKVLSPKLNLDP